jgi:hypothetical protein
MHVLGRAFVVLAIAWAVVLPLATFAATRPASDGLQPGFAFALVIYRIGSIVCHQRPERSFQLFAGQMPVCARCTGIYVGAALMALVAPLRRPRVARTDLGDRLTGSGSLAAATEAKWLLLISVLPMAATLVYEWSTGTTPAHWIRAASGLLVGATVSWIVCASLSTTREVEVM